ncbi:MAG: hypothetical protein ACOVQE_06325 [Chitinophagaceae bacterium]
MKIISLLCLLISGSIYVNAQNSVEKAFQKGNQSLNKVQNIIQVFQPYLIKAQEIYQQGKDLATQVKGSAKSVKANLQTNTTTNNVVPPTNTDPGYTTSPPSSGQTYTPPVNNNNYPTNYGSNTNYGNNGNYSPQSLPINNPATINNDGTGNWGNQNNALFGNCLDVLTGTVMGMGEAEEAPGSIDIIFAVANGAYGLYTPNFIRNNATATYMTNHSTDGVAKWHTVNETEIAETKITLSQFEQIQTNPQISNVVKNATNYAGYIQFTNTKLDGKVFAVKAELDNRTVYGLIAIVKHIGTDGSNGYLKIKVKSLGLDNNHDGRPDASLYIRN